MVHVIYSWIYLVLFQNNFVSSQFWLAGAMHSVQNLNVSYDLNAGVYRPDSIYLADTFIDGHKYFRTQQIFQRKGKFHSFSKRNGIIQRYSAIFH